MVSKIVIKKEKVDDPKPGPSAPRDDDMTEIEARILELLREYPKGINDKILETHMSNLDKQIQVIVLNRLLTQVKILMEL